MSSLTLKTPPWNLIFIPTAAHDIAHQTSFRGFSAVIQSKSPFCGPHTPVFYKCTINFVPSGKCRVRLRLENPTQKAYLTQHICTPRWPAEKCTKLFGPMNRKPFYRPDSEHTLIVVVTSASNHHNNVGNLNPQIRSVRSITESEFWRVAVEWNRRRWQHDNVDHNNSEMPPGGHPWMRLSLHKQMPPAVGHPKTYTNIPTHTVWYFTRPPLG